MDTHVRLLGVLYLACGALSGILGLALIALGVGAAAVAGGGSPGSSFVAQVTAATFFMAAAAMFGWGFLSACAGRALQRYRPWARPAVLVLALLNLFVVPFGTALGIYSFWVLLGDQARQRFEPGQ